MLLSSCHSVGRNLVAHYRWTVLAQQRRRGRNFARIPQLTGVASSPLAPALKVMWTFDAGEAIESSAAIADGAVYVGSAAGELIALDFQTGAVRWRYRTGEIGESSPAVANGVVYVGDLTGTFHAVDAKTGKALWTYQDHGRDSIVAGRGGRQGADRILRSVSLRAVGGARAPSPGRSSFRATCTRLLRCVDGVAYISGCDETFRGIRVADGREVLNVPIGAYMGASAALAGGAAYVGTFENEVIGIDMKSRKVMWTYRHPERLFPYYSSAAFSQGRVVLGGRDKMIHALDAKTGKAHWTFMTNARVESSPAIVGNRVFVGSTDGRLYELDLMKGAKMSGSSTQALRLPRLPPSRTAASSSAPTTAVCTASDRPLSLRAGTVVAVSDHWRLS